MDLIIDGNAFINVAISVSKSVVGKDKRFGETYYVNDLFTNGFRLKEEIRISFRNFCFTYLNSLIAPIGSSLDRVHLVFDSKSWRKEYLVTFFEELEKTDVSDLEEFSYKGTRKYDEHQYLFFDYFQQTLLPELCEKCGVNYYRFREMEGDDIIAYLCEIINSDILIYSVDQDLKQLIASTDKNVLLIIPKQMSKTKKLFSPINLRPALATDEIDDFFSLSESHISGSSVETLIKTLKSKDYAEFKIDPQEEVLTKILLGDKSDHIPKIPGLTPSKAKKIIISINEKFGERTLYFMDKSDPEFIGFIVTQICETNKIKDQEKRDQVMTRLLLNIKLIRLSSQVFPTEIKGELDRFFEHYQMSNFKAKEFTTLRYNQSSL